MPEFQVAAVTWQEQRGALSTIRRAVFIAEQRVPEALEWDDMDAVSRHVLATGADGAPMGCGRLTPERQIGRMAVLPDWRSRGVGRAMLTALLEIADERGYPDVWLHAQISALGFYGKAAFSAEGAAFIEAGILHQRMVLALPTDH